jgi:beta-lactamase regulating signal transducer with metallopeptidase domain
MSVLTALSTSRVVAALGWTLLHSMWIGTTMAIVLKGLLAAFHRATAATRYSMCCASGASLMVLLGMTFQRELRSAELNGNASESSPITTVAAAGVNQPNHLSLARPAASEAKEYLLAPDFNRLLAWVVLAWAVGATVLSARLLGGCFHVRRLRRHASTSPSWCLACAAKIADQLAIANSVRVLVSSAIDVPCVIGWLKPVVLLPPAVLSGLSIGQLETILAHELAHIARHDYLANILQSIAETLLFYHPAVWWLSRRMRIERENCCDDVAVELCGNKVIYAQALEAIEMLRIRPTGLAVAANGTDLLPRIRRLAAQKKFDNAPSRWPAGAVIVGTLLLAQIVTSCVQQNAAKPIAASTQPVAIATQPAAEAETFESVYKLAPGEIAKFIPAPFLPDRMESIYGGSGSMLEKGQVIFHWTKAGVLKKYSLSFGTGNVTSALWACGLQLWEIEAADKANPSLLHTPVDGDWIFREDASRDEKLDAAVKILAKRFAGFQLQPRFVQRDVLLAKGSFHPDQHPNLYISAPEQHGQNGGGTGTIDQFFDRIGQIEGTRVVDQTEPMFDTFTWREDVSVALYHGDGTRLFSAAEILGELEKETGLKFVSAKQRETIYFVSAAR